MTPLLNILGGRERSAKTSAISTPPSFSPPVKVNGLGRPVASLLDDDLHLAQRGLHGLRGRGLGGGLRRPQRFLGRGLGRLSYRQAILGLGVGQTCLGRGGLGGLGGLGTRGLGGLGGLDGRVRRGLGGLGGLDGRVRRGLGDVRLVARLAGGQEGLVGLGRDHVVLGHRRPAETQNQGDDGDDPHRTQGDPDPEVGVRGLPHGRRGRGRRGRRRRHGRRGRGRRGRRRRHGRRGRGRRGRRRRGHGVDHGDRGTGDFFGHGSLLEGLFNPRRSQLIAGKFTPA